ncbi:TonB-dependent receptor plug domain-containing protein [Muricauda sp. CAU 1633]|uniref:TonB-dependent receptor plug domain-containing protein n=1 Tax=Allomuricauda sp. CAU 1633 TaxID=2816036 RepID=UPI001A8C5F5C|nr:TonB-dependent receptor plug domain-containing protein [Muricauda sp. CAU 1633]MBO0323387.1 TonB-dependent receptor plug domain-containing protein [Muricauda sp. CAU 1633]
MKLTNWKIILICFLIGFSSNAQEYKNVSICWDASLSMQNRDIEKDFYFLDAYFKTVQNAQVSLVTFSDRVLSKDTHQVTSGDWSSIKKELQALTYDGATSYESLSSYVDTGEVLFFTDGKQNLGSGTPNFNGELYIINSNKSFDKASLNLLSIVNNGNLVDFNEKKDSDAPFDNTNQYSGTIYSGTAGLQGADIYVQGNESNRVKSNVTGGFSIDGRVGDTLVVAYGNKLEKQVLGENNTLNFSLEDQGIQLQEVVVSETIGEPEETITTGYGEENKDKVGYAVQSISSDDISDAATTPDMAIQGKFSGVNLGQNEDLSQVTMRPRMTLLGNVYGLIVIDGVPLRQSDSASGTVFSSDFINPENIAEITVLKGLAATNKYGSLGVNGVLLITSKTATYAKESGGKPDMARLRDNIYEDKIKVNNKTLVTPYLKELKNGKSIREAYDIYLNQRERYWNAPEYFLDVSNFFLGSSPDLAERILSNVLEVENPPYEALRALFLKCTEQENHAMAVFAADKMLEFFPNKIQSYFDVALAQKNVGNLQESLNMLNGMVSGDANLELNFSPMEKMVGTEIRNMLNQNKGKLDIDKVDAKYRNNVTYNARLILDWSVPDAEFSVQFVNPQKRFFTWEHTEIGDRKRILEELQNGNSSEQFEIVGAETKGEWILNATYLGNRTPKNEAATFLKCTVQYNFGKPNQRSEEFIIRLQENGDEQQLARFTVD